MMSYLLRWFSEATLQLTAWDRDRCWKAPAGLHSALFQRMNHFDGSFSCHYPIFNRLLCELLRAVSAHATWFCHLSRGGIKRNVDSSIGLQGTQPLHCRWIEQKEKVDSPPQLSIESNKWQGERRGPGRPREGKGIVLERKQSRHGAERHISFIDPHCNDFTLS